MTISAGPTSDSTLLPATAAALPRMSEAAAGAAAAMPTSLRRLRARFNDVRGLEPSLRRPKAYVNWIRANYELLRRSSVIKARPLKLTFDPTNYCQLRCPLCPTGARIHDRDRGQAQRHLFEHLMQEVGDYVFLIDFFNWGEPLLNEHTEELVAMAGRYNVVSVLSSNLSVPLSDARIRRLIESGLNRLIVSLDGASAETYGTYRRQGRFDLVMSNMQRVLALRREMGVKHPQIDWQYLVFRFNEHEIPRARALAAQMGVDKLTFRAPFLDEGRFPLSERDAAAVATWAPTSPEFNRYDPSSDACAEVPARPRCGWHYMSTAINWDGSVAPCCTVYERKDDFGSLATEPRVAYMELVNNTQFRAARDSFAGRRPGLSNNVVCDHCPTPSMMAYHHHLNRQILMLTAASVLDGLRHPLRRLFRPRAVSTVLSPETAAGASDTAAAKRSAL